MIPSAVCNCGAENQTAKHVIAHCLLFSSPHGITGLVQVNDDTIILLHESCPDIQNDHAHTKEVMVSLQYNFFEKFFV